MTGPANALDTWGPHTTFKRKTLVAQWIEQRFPKPRAQVRFLPGASTRVTRAARQRAAKPPPERGKASSRCNLARAPSVRVVTQQLTGGRFDQGTRLFRGAESSSDSQFVDLAGYADLALRHLRQREVGKAIHQSAEGAACTGLRNHEIDVPQDECLGQVLHGVHALSQLTEIRDRVRTGRDNDARDDRIETVEDRSEQA